MFDLIIPPCCVCGGRAVAWVGNVYAKNAMSLFCAAHRPPGDWVLEPLTLKDEESWVAAERARRARAQYVSDVVSGALQPPKSPPPVRREVVYRP